MSTIPLSKKHNFSFDFKNCFFLKSNTFFENKLRFFHGRASPFFAICSLIIFLEISSLQEYPIFFKCSIIVVFPVPGAR